MNNRWKNLLVELGMVEYVETARERRSVEYHSSKEWFELVNKYDQIQKGSQGRYNFELRRILFSDLILLRYYVHGYPKSCGCWTALSTYERLLRELYISCCTEQTYFVILPPNYTLKESLFCLFASDEILLRAVMDHAGIVSGEDLEVRYPTIEERVDCRLLHLELSVSGRELCEHHWSYLSDGARAWFLNKVP